jgi:hypothetical protein
MKWHWAILLTIGIFGCMVAATGVAGDKADHLIHAIIAISAVWAASHSASFGWGLLVLLFWPIAFPWFLMARYKREPTGVETEQKESARSDIVECPSCGTMIPPGETKCPRCGWV